MSKITIELEDTTGQIGLNVTVTDYSDTSQALNLGEALLQHLDDIAERQMGAPPTTKPLIHVPNPSLRGPDMRRLALTSIAG